MICDVRVDIHGAYANLHSNVTILKLESPLAPVFSNAWIQRFQGAKCRHQSRELYSPAKYIDVHIKLPFLVDYPLKGTKCQYQSRYLYNQAPKKEHLMKTV
jgi:hypothetical protein